jgi:peptidoglycan/LPS O-acetylase OafA/YrhL
MAESKRAFVTLDGLRGIAALAIVARHAPVFFNSVSIYVQSDIGKPIALGPFFESYLAVDFFFALSGFVLAHAYGQRLREGMPASQFMTVRLIRLYPLYLLALAMTSVIAIRQMTKGEIVPSSFARNLIPALLFLPSPASATVLFPLNGPAWSLFFELIANGVFGSLGRRLTGTILVTFVAIAGTVLTGAVVTGAFGFGASGQSAMADGFEWSSLGAGLLRVTYSFFAGILVYRIWTRSRPPIHAPVLVVMLVLAAVLISHPPERYQTAFDLSVTLIGFPVLIWLGASSLPNGAMARLCHWLGVASYAVYVLQAPLYNFIMRGLASLQMNSDHIAWPWGLAFVGLVLAVAIIADQYFDWPVRQMLTARLRTRGKFARVG